MDYKDVVHVDRLKPYYERIGRAVDPIYLIGDEDYNELVSNMPQCIGPLDTEAAIQANAAKKIVQKEFPTIGVFKPPEETTYEEIQANPPAPYKPAATAPTSDRVLRSTFKKVINKITAPFK